MSSQTTHKYVALVATFVLLLLLGFLIVRQSSLANTVIAFLKGPPSPADAKTQKAPLSVPELIKLVKPSVVEITVYDSSGERFALASGFFTGPRQVISNWHVVDECYKAEVKTVDGEIYSVKGVLAFDKETDLVLLEIDIPLGKARSIKIAAKPPDEGERIVVIGNPLGLEGTVSDGIVSGIRDIPKLGRLLQVTAPISHGSSGGPVVNMLGEVVGVARAALSTGQNLNFAVPGNEILGLKEGRLQTFVEMHHRDAVGKYEEALILSNRGSCDAAIPLLEQAVTADQNYESAWLQLGSCEFKVERYDDALSAFEQVIRINPQSEEALYEAGRSSAELEHWQSAAGYYRKVIQLNPRHEDAQFGLGLVMCVTGDATGAMQIYRGLVRMRSKRAQELYEAYPEIFSEESP